MLGASVLLGGLSHQDILCVAVRRRVPLCRLDDVDGLQGNIAAVDVKVCLAMASLACGRPGGVGDGVVLTADKVKVGPVVLLWLDLVVVVV